MGAEFSHRAACPTSTVATLVARRPLPQIPRVRSFGEERIPTDQHTLRPQRRLQVAAVRPESVRKKVKCDESSDEEQDLHCSTSDQFVG